MNNVKINSKNIGTIFALTLLIPANYGVDLFGINLEDLPLIFLFLVLLLQKIKNFNLTNFDKVFYTFLIFFIISLMLSLTGLDFLTAVSGAASAISNVGPGLGDIIGPDGNYKNIPDISKWILAFGMLLGRLELFAILVLFFPSFWRN